MTRGTMNPSMQLAKLPAATVYEASGKRGDMSPEIRQMVPGTRLAGPAFTVRCLPGDFAAVLRAIDKAKRGDVLVIDGGGSDRVTAIGGTSSLACRTRGLAGVAPRRAIAPSSSGPRCTSVRAMPRRAASLTGAW